MCHSAETDGYAFCAGLDAIKLASDDSGVQSQIRSATYLIHDAALRPRYATSHLDRFSLNIRPLAELLDMFHDRKATDPRDKVYALLGMSSDVHIPANLLPDYGILWKDLFCRLCKSFVGEQTFVKTWEEGEIAVIKSKGCVLGWVSKVEYGSEWADKQNVDVTLANLPWHRGQEKARWVLQASAKPIRHGDVVCLLQEASRPMIIRSCEDYCAVIAISVPPTGYKQAEGSRSETDFPRDFLLVWDWEKSWERVADGKDYEGLMSSGVLNLTTKETESHMDKATRLDNMGLILTDVGKLEEANERLRKAIGARKRALGKGLSHTLAAMDNLVSMFRTRHDQEKAGKLGVMIDLLGRRGKYAQITEEGAARIARSFDQEVITLLLDWREDDVKITEEVVKAAAGNEGWGEAVMALLLDQRGNEVKITEEVVKAAAGNEGWGGVVMTLLLDRRGNEIEITEEVVKAVAGNKGWGGVVMALLLDRHGNEVKITEEVFKAAAGNKRWGEEMMALFLDRRGNEVERWLK